MDERFACYPWQFKKVDGTWRRRPANTNGRWQTLSVQRLADPSAPRKDSASRNKGKIAPPSINRWQWK